MDPAKLSGEVLPRGGRLIRTSQGNLQYGIPSETIKDTMLREGGVPLTYVVPPVLFDLASCASLSDLEFPLYYNFFLRRTRTRVVCTAAEQARIEAVLREALFGPPELEHAAEFVQGRDAPDFPDLRAEMLQFRRMDQAATGLLQLSDLVEFHLLDAQGRLTLAGPGELTLCRSPTGELQVWEPAGSCAHIGSQESLIPRDPPQVELPEFRPPRFGVTMLGAGHGFDPAADTSGFILWINRRGVVVDPPVGSTGKLLRLGVSPKWIDRVILTHCHADHDAGTLQKILQEGRVRLHTTPTIFESFLRKSEAVTGVGADRLRQLVQFHPVRLGEPQLIDGARCTFHYTLHSIPTISMQVALAGQRIVYSSDTMNEPAFIRQLHERGVISAGRRDALLAFPWDADLILHEAGIPPIHTPLSFLCSLPEPVRARLFLVHVAQHQVPPASGLRVAPTGLQNTVELPVPPSPHEDALAILDTLRHAGLAENVPLSRAWELLLASRLRHAPAGTVLFAQGDPAGEFFIVQQGEVDILLDDRVLTTYGVGGFFGEKGLFGQVWRTATAVARSSVRLLVFQRDELLDLLQGTECEELLRRIAAYQSTELRTILAASPLFSSLTPAQLTRLHGVLRPDDQHYPPGATILAQGEPCHSAWLIEAGAVRAEQPAAPSVRLTRGDLFGVAPLFSPERTANRTFVAQEEVRLRRLPHPELQEYLARNPGLHLKLFRHPW